MSANPTLVLAPDGSRVPAPFPSEVILCQRKGMGFNIDGVNTRNGKWNAKGDLFVTTMRMVFVAKSPDSSGLEAFDIPLLYIRNDSFNQPIFGCNNLAGECWPVAAEGGPGGSLPPHKYRINFLEGGIGTILPLYYRFLKLVRASEHDRRAREELANQNMMNEQSQQAFVDPNDPTTIFLTQPVGPEARLASAPVYASNYGQDEAYAPMV